MNFNIPKTISTPQTIAIIGGGFSGSMIAAHLLRANVPLCIKLIERRPEAGRGTAYSTSVPAHLLNVPAGKMSAFPNQPEHFLQWLKNQWLQNRDPLQVPAITDLSAATFVPRMVYGDYIRSILSDAIIDASEQVRFERITDEAVAIKPSSQGAVIHLSTGESLCADRVVLATGNFPASLPVSTEQLNQLEDIKEAWSWDAVAHLSADAPVLLVGTGLTMVDMVIALHQQGHQGQIYAVSRHGLLPQSHQATVSRSAFLSPETAPKTVRELLRFIRQNAATQEWRSVIDALRPVTQQLWQNLPLVEQQRFRRHVKAYWETHRHRVAPEIGAVLSELIQARQLVHYAGRIQLCQQSKSGISVTLHQRGTGEILTLNVQRLINCTGSNCNYRHIQHPLIVSLQEQQLIRPSALGLGIDTNDAGAVIDANSQTSCWLYTLGTTRRGTLWETTAVPELRVQAQDLAQTLLNSLAPQLQFKLPGTNLLGMSRSIGFITALPPEMLG